ncbi:hypothetical protein GCM10023220_35570 [Streptomyces ziwulingensis]|uniref:Uncharacterized protein n=1 Tax=Streptomyces ziwulingensis TaxID=1045501 RepID=A0ABP9C5I5_9ACTN
MSTLLGEQIAKPWATSRTQPARSGALPRGSRGGPLMVPLVDAADRGATRAMPRPRTPWGGGKGSGGRR